MSDIKDNHFNKIFWFIVYLTSFGMLLTIFLIQHFSGDVAQRFADQSMIFWLTTAVGGGIGYLIGSSISRPDKKTPDVVDGTTTADISATITTKTDKDGTGTAEKKET